MHHIYISSDCSRDEQKAGRSSWGYLRILPTTLDICFKSSLMKAEQGMNPDHMVNYCLLHRGSDSLSLFSVWKRDTISLSSTILKRTGSKLEHIQRWQCSGNCDIKGMSEGLTVFSVQKCHRDKIPSFLDLKYLKYSHRINIHYVSLGCMVTMNRWLQQGSIPLQNKE